MKKLIMALSVLLIAGGTFSQSCEEREDQLLGMMGGMSAGFLYNTYGLIGSIGDGYRSDAYDLATVTDLLDAQIKLAGNMIVLLEKKISGNAFKKESNKTYISSSMEVIKGLKIQAQLLLALVKNDSPKNRNAYGEQRDKNWKDISQLMGISE
jgi:hypothetical protein